MLKEHWKRRKEMEIIAIQKYLRMSPKKLRLVVDIAKGFSPTEAVQKLPFIGKRAAEPITKTIKAAIANAKNKGLSEDDLIFKEIQINEGPRLKRGRPVSRGMWHPIAKRMSHIRVVLTTRKPEVPSTKSETNSNTENSKVKKAKGGKSRLKEV